METFLGTVDDADEEEEDEDDFDEDCPEWNLYHHELYWYQTLLPYKLGCLCLFCVTLLLGAGAALGSVMLTGRVQVTPLPQTEAFASGAPLGTPPPTVIPTTTTTNSWSETLTPTPLRSLLERDHALAEIAGNYWTAVLTPAVAGWAAQSRAQPIWIGGGMMVAALQLCGAPGLAGAVALSGLMFTGRTFANLWHAPTVQAGGPAQTHTPQRPPWQFPNQPPASHASLFGNPWVGISSWNV